MVEENDIIALKRRISELEQENEWLKKQQNNIESAKELYLKIFEDFPALIWRSRLDKLCDYFNKTWLDFTGRTMEQEFGNGWAEGVHKDDLDFCIQTYNEKFEKREPFLMEYRLKNKYGEYRWIRDFGRPFYDLDNSFIGYIGSCYDITENVNYEIKLRELNATKDKFFSIIAHDLRNPFNQILGYSELLVKKYVVDESNDIKALAVQLHQSTLTAFKLLNNLLEWASTQSLQILDNLEEIKLSDLMDDVIEYLITIAKDKNILLTSIASKNVKVLADRRMLETILRNLITNAIKYSNINGRIEVSASESADSTIICVSDNGVGMSKEHARGLFKIGENRTMLGTSNEKGSGLGLIICNEFVEKHKGKIWVETELGKGSSFFVSFPK